uniref:Uncharacterized protein n=1 Tax=Cacopsylla melanoneura TaxID=428564 RepID=A0A8D8LVH9_9HEMI
MNNISALNRNYLGNRLIILSNKSLKGLVLPAVRPSRIIDVSNSDNIHWARWVLKPRHLYYQTDALTSYLGRQIGIVYGKRQTESSEKNKLKKQKNSNFTTTKQKCKKKTLWKFS